LVYPNDVHYAQTSAGKIGMWLFLLSDGFSFSGLLLGYGILRGGSEYWGCFKEQVAQYGCTLEPDLGILFTSVLTFLLICSSVTMVISHSALVSGDKKTALKYLGLTILGGTLFLCGQYQEYFGIVGHGLISEGLIFGASHYATTFYCITAFHGMHVTAGVIYLSCVWVALYFDKADANTLEIAGLFWHFVDLVWIMVFTFIYLIPS
jgi:heme/copper-type cytochrome/quinol oxidase subunit 3